MRNTKKRSPVLWWKRAGLLEMLLLACLGQTPVLVINAVHQHTLSIAVEDKMFVKQLKRAVTANRSFQSLVEVNVCHSNISTKMNCLLPPSLPSS